METAKTETPREAILRTMGELQIALTYEFVPFSQSRNAKPREDGKVWRSLNWRVTLKRNGRDVLTCDYSAGEAHCPAYNLKDPYHRRTGVEFEIEHGKRAARVSDVLGTIGGKVIEPDACDVLHSLALDADVIDCAGFEDWASNFGYDTDSRKAEAVYRECLEQALKLRAALGEDGLRKLREACQEY